MFKIRWIDLSLHQEWRNSRSFILPLFYVILRMRSGCKITLKNTGISNLSLEKQDHVIFLQEQQLSVPLLSNTGHTRGATVHVSPCTTRYRCITVV